MWLHLRRGLDDVLARIDETRLRIYEGNRCKVAKEVDGDRAALEAQIDKLVARRIKAGWTLVTRLESAWQPWLQALERRHAHVIEHASAVGVRTCFTSFQIGYPRGAPAIVPAAWQELFLLTSILRLTWYFERGGTELALGFEIHPFVENDGRTRFWSQRNPRFSDLDAVGHFDAQTGQLVNTVGKETLVHATPEEFRAWFLRRVDDVTIDSIADL